MTTSTKSLIAALERIRPGTGRTTLDAFKAVRLLADGTKLTLTTADAEMMCRLEVPCDGQIDCAVNHESLLSAAAAMTVPEVQMEVAGQKLIVRGGKVRYSLPLVDWQASEPDVPSGEEIEVDLGFLQACNRIVVQAAGVSACDLDQVVIQVSPMGDLMAIMATDRRQIVVGVAECETKECLLRLPVTTFRRLAVLATTGPVTFHLGPRVGVTAGDAQAWVSEASVPGPLAWSGVSKMLASSGHPAILLPCDQLLKNLHHFTDRTPIPWPVHLEVAKDAITVTDREGDFEAQIECSSADEFKVLVASDHLSRFINGGPFMALEWSSGEQLEHFSHQLNDWNFHLISSKYRDA